jgi:hypothetical protein
MYITRIEEEKQEYKEKYIEEGKEQDEEDVGKKKK